MIKRYGALLSAGLLLLVGVACAGTPTATPLPLPTLTPIPWRNPGAVIGDDNLASLALLGRRMLPTSGTIFHMDFSADGRSLVTVSGDDVLRVWDVQQGAVRGIQRDADAGRAFFAMDDAVVVAVERGTAVAVYAANDLEPVRRFEGHTERLGPASVSPDGRLLALGTYDGQLVIWNLADEALLATIPAHSEPVRGVTFSPDGTLVATMSSERAVRLWNMASGSPQAVVGDFDERPQMLAFSPDGTRLAGNFPQEVRLWSTVDGTLHQTLTSVARAATRQIMFVDDQTLVAGGETDTVALWDLVANEVSADLLGHGETFTALALHPDRTLLVTVAQPGHVFLWDLTRPGQRVEIGTVEDQIVLPGWTSDGRVLVLAAADGTLHFWGVPG